MVQDLRALPILIRDGGTFFFAIETKPLILTF